MVLNPVALTKSAWNAARQVVSTLRGGSSFFFVGRSDAGVHVTHENAFMVSAVWACVDVIASALASSDWNVYGGVRGSDQGKSVLYEDSLQYVLNSRFNPDMTAQAGKRAVAIAAVAYGNGYAEIQYDGAGRIVALWPIAPNRVEPIRAVDDGRLLYRCTQEGTAGWVDLEAGDIFHLRGASLTGFGGDDPIARAIKSIGMSIALEQFGSSYFANGTQFGGFFKVKGTMGKDKKDQLRADIEAQRKGTRNAFKNGILDDNIDYLPAVTADAQKAQMIEARYQLVEETCRWFRVPPHKVAHLLRSTNNNIEHQGLEFSRDTLRPWVREIQEESDYKLIPFRGPRKYIELDVDWASEGDYKSRAEALQILRNTGLFSTNDCLRKLGENTISAADGGDLRLVNGAAIPLTRVGDAYASAAALPQPAAGPSEGAQVVTQAWVTSLFNRIARRHENRLADLHRAGKPDAAVLARDDAIAYSEVALREARGALGDRFDRAQAAAADVVDGKAPTLAAADLFEHEKEPV